jgi:ectoine hydroxylase-related dioxygenase (phytanoyl-CoA dioxygenase family)
MSAFVDQIASSGFAIVPSILSKDTLETLERDLPTSSGGNGGLRNLLDTPPIATLAARTAVRGLIEPVLGQGAFPVRAILFDKTPVANWKVSWHQDLTIAVKARAEVAGYGPWSEKAGVVHVQPPVSILEQMLALRLHIDDSGPANGPLRVLPGSHWAGRLRDAEIPEWRERLAEHVCLVPRGGALLMRPLLLHASSPAETPEHRRVIHIEYANCALAGGLQWRWGESRARAA